MNTKNLVTILLGLALMNTLPLAATADDTPEETIVNTTPTVTTPRVPNSINLDPNGPACAVDDPNCMDTNPEHTDCHRFPDCEENVYWPEGNDECSVGPSWGWITQGFGDGTIGSIVTPGEDEEDRNDWTHIPVLRTELVLAIVKTSDSDPIELQLQEDCSTGTNDRLQGLDPDEIAQATLRAQDNGFIDIGIRALQFESTTRYDLDVYVNQNDAADILLQDPDHELQNQAPETHVGDAGDTRQTATLLEPTTVGDPIEWSGAVDQFRDGILDPADWYEIKPRYGSYQVTLDVDCTGAGDGLELRVVYERPTDIPQYLPPKDRHENERVSCGTHHIDMHLLELPWPLKIGVGTNLDQEVPTPDGVAYAYTVTVERIPTVLDEVFVNTVASMYTDPALDQVPDPLPDPPWLPVPAGWEECVETYAQALIDLLFPSPQGVECEEEPFQTLPPP